jgi:hypothetical protein
MKRSKGQSPEKNKKTKKNAPTIQGKPLAKRDRNTAKSAGSGTHFDPVKIGLIILFAAAVGIGTAVYLTYMPAPPQQTEAIQAEGETVTGDLPVEQTDSDQADQSPET